MIKTQNSQRNRNIIYIILINLIPLFGYLFYKWDIFNIMFFYWVETFIALFFTFIFLFITESYETLFGVGSFGSLSKYRIVRIFEYLIYGFFWLIPQILIFGFIGMYIFIFFHPVYPGWYIPNEVLLNIFKNTLTFIYMIIILYLIKFINDVFSKKISSSLFTKEKYYNDTHIHKNLYQKNLYIRSAVLIATLLLTGLLMHYLNIPVIMAIFIFTFLKIYFEFKFSN